MDARGPGALLGGRSRYVAAVGRDVRNLRAGARAEADGDPAPGRSLHFIDDVEKWHETFRTMPLTGDLAKLQAEMRPIGELCSGEEAHLFVCGLTLAHFDATLRRQEQARKFLDGDIEAALAVRGVEAAFYSSGFSSRSVILQIPS